MKLQTMILNKNYKIIFPFFYFLISLKISKAVSAGERKKNIQLNNLKNL